MRFISSSKLFSFSRYLNSCLDFLVIEKVNFEVYDVKAWLANNWNRYIAKEIYQSALGNEVDVTDIMNAPTNILAKY